MPFPYVSKDDFEAELPFDREYLDIDGSGWDSLLTRSLKGATERVETYINDDTDWRGDGETAPFVIQEAVIRLARARISRVHEDGLSSEASASGSQQSYRAPAKIRNEVKAELAEAGYRTTTETKASASVRVPDAKK